MAHFVDLLFIPGVIGVQGIRHLFLISTMKRQRWVFRPSAITGICRHWSQTTGISCSGYSRYERHRTGCGMIFISVTGICDGHLSQAAAALDSCAPSGAQLHALIMWVQHTLMWKMLNDSSEVNPLKVIFIITSLTVFSVGDLTTISVILFDTVVVIAMVVGTLGTWRIYRRSAWSTLTLSHLLAEQSMWLSLWYNNSHIQTSGLLRFGYFSRIYSTNAN